MANVEWIQKFTTAEATFLPERFFYHSLALLKHYTAVEGKKPFRFFNMWCTHPMFKDIVEDQWMKCVRGYTMFQITQKLRMLNDGLKKLNEHNYADIVEADRRDQKNLQKCQANLHEDPCNLTLIHEEYEAHQEFKRVHADCIKFLQQKEKGDWIINDDDNTRMFHKSLKVREFNKTELILSRIRMVHGSMINSMCARSLLITSQLL